MLKMSGGTFMFYRGSAKFYYRDMQQQNVVVNSPFYSAKARTWLQADMHMSNAGRFQASNGAVLYDVNDFDESFVGSYLYDVYRLAASVALVAQETESEKRNDGEPPKWLEDRNAETSHFVCRFATAYKRQIEALAKTSRNGRDNNPLDEDNTEPGLIRDLFSKKPGANEKWIDRKTETLRQVKGSLKKIKHKEVKEEIEAAVKEYAKTTDMFKELGEDDGRKYFHVLDVKERLDAGTGSLGTKRFYVLVAGSKKTGLVLLDVKQQGAPAWHAYLSVDEKEVAYGGLPDGADEREAARVVLAYKKMVSYGPDKHLGALTLSGKKVKGTYSVRERSAYKKSLKLIVDDTDDGPVPVYMSKGELELLAEQYGRLLANAHDRASDGTNKTPDDFAGEVWPLLKGRGDEFVSRVDTVGCAYARQVWVDVDLTLADW